MRPTNIRSSRLANTVVLLDGGLNENVSSLELKGGELIQALNYELVEGSSGGYRSIKGYERYDGSTLTSEYKSVVLKIYNASTAITSGDRLDGQTSGASAYALENGNLLSGSYIEADAVVEVQCRINIDNSWTVDELVDIFGSSTVGQLSRVITLFGGTEDYHLAEEYYRPLVTEVPGAGPILGVHIYNGSLYAFRNHTDNLSTKMWKATTSGWTEIDTTTTPLTGISPDGEYNFMNYNFKGTSGTTEMFWTNGVNKCMSFDGTTVTEITNTGMGVDDKPINLIAHNNRLFLAYRLSSLQYSNLGDPNDWSTGSGEIGLGGGVSTGREITALQAGVENSLIVFCEDAINIMKGSVPAEWVLEVFSDISGAFTRTPKRMLGTIYFMDDRGVANLEAVQDFGNYVTNSISEKVKRSLLASLDNVTVATTRRGLNQYRLFLDNGGGFTFSFKNKKLRGITKTYYNTPVLCVTKERDSASSDEVYFGSSTGYVYKMDSGNSFDGDPIVANLTTAFFHYNSPRNWKRFNKLTFEIATGDPTTFNIKPSFDYGSSEYARSVEESFEVLGAGGVWGLDEWGSLRLGGGRDTNRYYYNQLGLGTNMSVAIRTSETYKEQHTIQNFITDYSLLGRQN